MTPRRNIFGGTRGLKIVLFTAALSACLPASASLVNGRRAAVAAPVQTQNAPRATHPLDALDAAVQQRFHRVIGFGMARIATERKFEPETEAEKEAVRGLRRGGYRLALYLAGRGVLEPLPVKYRAVSTKFGTFGPGNGVAGPVFVSSSGIKGLPDANALWESARAGFETFAGGGERREFEEAEGWRIEARPVRASGESCLQCHKTDRKYEVMKLANGREMVSIEPKGNTLRLGDPLGVLLYVYRGERR